MNSDKFLFSIIIPVYNTGKYIEKCLKSVQEASGKDCEIIIVNDGSTDNSEEIILDFINNLPSDIKSNYIYTKKNNKGLADTKNVGIEKANGKYISVVDSDDYISKDFYTIARKYVDKYDIIVYDLYVVFEKDKTWNYTARAWRDDRKNELSAFLNGAMSGSSCNKIIKKELYNNYKFPVGKQYEDTAVTPFILTDAKMIKYIPYPLYYYLQREKSIVATNTLMSAFYKICKNITDVVKQKNNNYEKYKNVINEFFVDRILEIFVQDYNENKEEFISNITDFGKNNKGIINYIVEDNLIDNLENHYSAEQKNTVKSFFLLLSQDKYDELVVSLENMNKSKEEEVEAEQKNYFKNVKYTLKEFIKALLNR